VSDSKSNSGTGVEARRPETTLQASLQHTSKPFLSASQRKGKYPREAYERTDQMKALHSWSGALQSKDRTMRGESRHVNQRKGFGQKPPKKPRARPNARGAPGQGEPRLNAKPDGDPH